MSDGLSDERIVVGTSWIDQVCVDCGEQAYWVCVANGFNEGMIKVSQSQYDHEKKQHVVEQIPGRSFLHFKCETHYVEWIEHMTRGVE
jgi:hypothetical protein